MARSGTLRLLVAIVIASTLITPFGRELFVGDETKYSKVVREMRETGAYLLPTLEGQPFTHKPPLHFWVVAALTVPFGTHSIWPFVLPALAGFAFLLWLMWRMGGPLAAFVCGTSLLVWGSAQTARMDVQFTALITLGVWMMARFFGEEDEAAPASAPSVRPQARFLIGCAACLGVATMVKGPMSIVIGVVLFVLECIRRRSIPRGNYVLAIALMAAIPLIWFVPAMLLGGGTYTNEVLNKQLAGRAVSSWVHQSPPWYYLLHSPGFLFPWFLPAVAAIVARWRRERFLVNWILAVLIPYSLMSSKLDVYMMALIPPVALLIARYAEQPDRWLKRANVATLLILLVIGVAGAVVVKPSMLKGPEAALAGLLSVKLLFVVLAVAAAIALSASLWFHHGDTEGVGLVPIAMLVYAAVALMPIINGVASTRPLVAELARQRVPGHQIALFTSPHLWTRDMPPDLEHVRYVNAETAFDGDPALIATSRRYADRLGPRLSAYRKVAEVRMIGKWFDVYRR